MPIKVQCACGAAFAAKDELAGRTVKCPKCQQPLAIPAAGAPPVAAVAAASPRQMAAPLPSQASPAAHPSGDLFAEAGLVAQQAGTLPCPGCTNPMPVNAVVCIKCGYNKKLGRRMEVVKQTGGTDIPGGHNVSVEELLGKAAERIAEDKEEERKKTAEGMPWWLYLIGLTVLVSFMIAMMLIPQDTAMRVAGWTVFVLAWLVGFYSGLRILIIAFQESALQGALYLIVPFYPLFYIITRWDRCGGFFLMNLAATFFMGMGYGSVILADVLNQPDESSLHSPPKYALVIGADERTPIARFDRSSTKPRRLLA